MDAKNGTPKSKIRCLNTKENPKRSRNPCHVMAILMSRRGILTGTRSYFGSSFRDNLMTTSWHIFFPKNHAFDSFLPYIDIIWKTSVTCFLAGRGKIIILVIQVEIYPSHHIKSEPHVEIYIFYPQ